MKSLYTTGGMKEASAAAGHHWFDADTMRFWSSRVRAPVFPSEPGQMTYFVSSEHNFDRTARLYTVRVIDWWTVEVKTVGEFQGYKTRGLAMAAARKLARKIAVKPGTRSK